MSRITVTAFAISIMSIAATCHVVADEPAKTIRIGMIGLDTSHCLAFTELLSKGDNDPQLAGAKIVLVYPKGSPDIVSSEIERCLDGFLADARIRFGHFGNRAPSLEPAHNQLDGDPCTLDTGRPTMTVGSIDTRRCAMAGTGFIA